MRRMLSVAVGCTLGVGLLLTAGCVERRVVYVTPPPGAAQPAETVVATAPPAPQVEVVTVAPGPEYYWVPGYWGWNAGWVWIGGRWSVRPHPRAIWVGPRYERRGHGYVYHRGYWR